MQYIISICLILILASLAAACNQGLCASLVSKCLLIKSCECDMSDKKNCTCCKDCHMCLAESYSDCCSCVGMCPVTKITPHLRTSTVEDLPEPIPDLFDLLTEEDDKLHRLSIYRYPVYSTLTGPNTVHGLNVNGAINVGSIEPSSPFNVSTNCTVAYMAKCFSLSKCRMGCISMGATRMRWFHGGCCQCISHSCLDYGINKPRCIGCAESDGFYFGVGEDTVFDQNPSDEMLTDVEHNLVKTELKYDGKTTDFS